MCNQALESTLPEEHYTTDTRIRRYASTSHSKQYTADPGTFGKRNDPKAHYWLCSKEAMVTARMIGWMGEDQVVLILDGGMVVLGVQARLLW